MCQVMFRSFFFLFQNIWKNNSFLSFKSFHKLKDWKSLLHFGCKENQSSGQSRENTLRNVICTHRVKMQHLSEFWELFSSSTHFLPIFLQDIEAPWSPFESRFMQFYPEALRDVHMRLWNPVPSECDSHNWKEYNTNTILKHLFPCFVILPPSPVGLSIKLSARGMKSLRELLMLRLWISKYTHTEKEGHSLT